VQNPWRDRLPKRAALQYHEGLQSPGGCREGSAPPGDGCSMEPYRVLEHTADIGFEAFGATRQEVFANAARALVDLIVSLDSVQSRDEVSIRAEGSDSPSLLVNWLSEILYLHDAEGWLFRDFEIKELSDHSLSAVARGEKFNRSRHQAKLMVKAITYHQLALEEAAEGWRARVYLDI
jgi:SHS2 domain-containing protein